MRLNLRTSASTLALVLAATVYSQAARAADISQPVAEPDWYLSVFGGASFARGHATIDDQKDIRLDDGFLLGGAIGRDIGNGFRSELEISYATNDNDWSRDWEGASKNELNGSTSAVFLLGNLWKDIRLSDTVQPYLGGGVGVGILSTDSESDDEGDEDWDVDGVGLAGQLGAGVRFALTERLAIDAGYRLRAVVDASSDNGDDDNGVFSYYSHGVQLGASYALAEGSQIMAGSDDPSSWYVSLFAGAIFTETGWNYGGSSYLIDHKTGFTVGGAVGTHIAPELRAELELSYARSKLKDYSERDDESRDASGDLEQGFLLANIWKDFEFGWVTPYIGGGLGMGALHFENGELDGDKISNDTQFGLAGQFGVGARVAVADNMSIEIGYRFKSILDVLLTGEEDGDEDNSDVSTQNHVIQAGFNWGLGATVTPVADVAPEAYGANYVSVFGGVLLPEDTHANIDDHDYLVKFKTGFTVGAALGGNITENLRGEVEVSYQSFDVDEVDEGSDDVDESEGDVEGYFLMANLWRDFEVGGVRPYVGGGVGMALMDVSIVYSTDNHDTDHTDLALAAQAGAGLRVPVSESLTLDLGYRFRGAMSVLTEGANNDDNNSSTYYTHSGQVGVQWAY